MEYVIYIFGFFLFIVCILVYVKENEGQIVDVKEGNLDIQGNRFYEVLGDKVSC